MDTSEHELSRWLQDELREVERRLATLTGGGEALERAARTLLGPGGKRLRPSFVLLASRVEGPAPSGAARELAIAVELVHTASLLHDDVIDEGELRRGAPTARVRYGNAVSVLAGDWVLVEALALVREALEGRLLAPLLAALRAMSAAESLQLAHHGGEGPDRAAYYRIIDGKTAGLFAWSLSAGATASGCGPAQVDALERAGLELGRAFQIVDDVIDLSSTAEEARKSVQRDLERGQASHPIMLAREREPERVRGIFELPSPAARLEALLADDALLAGSRLEAAAHVARARAALSELPPGPPRAALEAVARSVLERRA